jgi:hypothetical protein
LGVVLLCERAVGERSGCGGWRMKDFGGLDF